MDWGHTPQGITGLMKTEINSRGGGEKGKPVKYMREKLN